MVFFICHVFTKQALILFSFYCTCISQIMHGLCFYELFSPVKCNKEFYAQNNNVDFNEVPEEEALPRCSLQVHRHLSTWGD